MTLLLAWIDEFAHWRTAQPDAEDESLIARLREGLAREAAVSHDGFLSGLPTKAGI